MDDFLGVRSEEDKLLWVDFGNARVSLYINLSLGDKPSISLAVRPQDSSVEFRMWSKSLDELRQMRDSLDELIKFASRKV